MRVLETRGLIGSVHNDEALDTAIRSEGIEMLFLMYGDIITIRNVVEKVHLAGKKVCVHVDFIQGLSTDKKGMEYLATHVRPDGILSTRGQVIQHAKKLRLYAIQRLFLVDSGALHSGIKSVNTSQPDAVEAMPGLMPRVIKELTEKVELPIVAGGLFKFKEELTSALNAGAISVSTGSPELWKEVSKI